MWARTNQMRHVTLGLYLSAIGLVGCGLDSKVNRVEQLNDVVKRLNSELMKIQDVESANSAMAVIQDAALEGAEIVDEVTQAYQETSAPGAVAAFDQKRWKSFRAHRKRLDDHLFRIGTIDEALAAKIRKLVQPILSGPDVM